jgi:2-succinyl-5-enolpyruvyl-6-hydroxy-3-cyclohexene-1-carboxylate synthase
MKINRNILWTETFVKELVSCGVKYACISPGSRNTPITYAIANNQQIKSFVHIDERSCSFFALGLAKSSDSPVILVSTSGTATAEFYPAIIEAYQQRVPLIVCTADRPPELLDCGENQTINQNNLYRNHIRWFVDVGVPEISKKRIFHIKNIARKSYYESLIRSKGPVHLNFPFRKPFEPETYTDEVDNEIIEIAEKPYSEKNSISSREERNILSELTTLWNEKWFVEIFNHISNFEKGIIVVGPENYNSLFHKKCKLLAEKLGYPIFADGASQLRFGKNNKENVLSNFEAVLKIKSFVQKHNPDIIIQFGRTPTSNALNSFLEKCDSLRYIINEYGDWFDPSNKATAAIACKPYIFCEKLLELLDTDKNSNRESEWLNEFLASEKFSTMIKEEIISNSQFPSEPRIIKELLDIMPENSNLMISNSMPIRDFDYFAYKTDKDIKIFNNRGASGIDGINSTAFGIAAESKKTTVLLTGDLAFYHDMNGLLAANKYSIPLIIILINNNGGGIFEVLPISKYKNIFDEFFITPHNLNFELFVNGYKGFYKQVESWDDLKNNFNKSIADNSFSVLEIRTNSITSLNYRNNYWDKVKEELPKVIQSPKFQEI